MRPILQIQHILPLLLALLAFGHPPTKPGPSTRSDDEGPPPEFLQLEQLNAEGRQSPERQAAIRSGQELMQRRRSGSPQEVNEEMKNILKIDVQEYGDPEAVDNRLILVLNDADGIAKTAGEDLYEKTQAVSGSKKALFNWDPVKRSFTNPEFSDNFAVTEDTKLIIVGHGSKDQNVEISGLGPKDIAEVVLSLRKMNNLHFSSTSIRAMSLVACNVGAGQEGEEFVRELLIHLKENDLKVDSVSARTAEVKVLPDGKKVTLNMEGEGWFRHGEGHKRYFFLDQNDQIKEKVIKHAMSEEPWSYELVAKDETTGKYYDFNSEMINSLIDQMTKKIFNSIKLKGDAVLQHTVSENMDVHVFKENVPPEIKNNVPVITIKSPTGSVYNAQDMAKKSAEMREDIINQNKVDLQAEGIVMGSKKTADAVWKQITTMVEKQLADEKNVPPGDQQKTPSRRAYEQMYNAARYFRFGNIIMKMDHELFYIDFYGTIGNNPPLDNNGKPLIKYDEKYDHMEPAYRSKFQEIAQLWENGKMEELVTKFPDLNGHNAMGVLATHVSEMIRNPRMFVVNQMLHDTVHTWDQFRKMHPMVGKGTWTSDHTKTLFKFAPGKGVKRKTQDVMKHWLIDRKVKDITFHEKTGITDEIISDQNKIEEFISKRLVPLLSSTDLSKHVSQIRGSLKSLHRIENIIMGKALKARMLLEMTGDRLQLQKALDEAGKKLLGSEINNYRLVPDSYVAEGDKVKVKLQNIEDPSLTKELSLDISGIELSSENVMESYLRDIGVDPSMKSDKVMGKVNHALGIYGTFMGFKAAKTFFDEGRTTEGGISFVQGVHGVGELSGVNELVYGVVEKSTGQALRRVAETLERETAEKVVSTMSELGEVAKTVPVLAIAFTGFNIYEDVKEGSTIGYVDAALDGAILLTALAGPELAPLTLALTIIRLSIDPFYNEIKHELESLPDDASSTERFVAVMKGIGLALKDIGKSLLDIAGEFTVWSLAYRIPQLDEQHRKDMALIEELRNADNYYQVIEDTKDGPCFRTLNFASGQDSAFGGSMDVQLTEDNCVDIEIVDPVTSKKLSKHHCFNSECEVHDFVMGIGEVHKIQLTKKSVTLLFFIPVHSQEVIESITEDKTTLHGTYQGNSKPNRFFSVQKLSDSFKYSLSDYFYELKGEGGSDAFYLGPQRSHIIGGNGNDLYVIPETGGVAVIDNNAIDGAMDLLIINVRFSQISSRKNDLSLNLFYNNLHQITIKNWFADDKYRHLQFKSNDSVFFQLGETTLNNYITLKAVQIDFSKETDGQSIDLRNEYYESVIICIGSPYNDRITGNHLSNMLLGGRGVDYLEGGNGKDTYIVEADNQCKTVNNYASDAELDIVRIRSKYGSLKVMRMNTRDIKVWDDVTTDKTCVIIQNWYRGWQWQHAIFMSEDFVTFQVSNTTLDHPEIIPLILDFSTKTAAVDCDLTTYPGNKHILTVVGSPYQDTISGNEYSNFLSGGNGDFLEGRGGKDTYVIECQVSFPKRIVVQNYDLDKSIDFVLLPEKFSSLIFSVARYTHYVQNFISKRAEDNLVIMFGNLRCEVVILQWFVSENHRHIVFQSKDGLTFTLPEEQGKRITPLVLAVDSSHSELKNGTIDVREGLYATAIKIIGSPAIRYIYGNLYNNYIDPGDGNTYIVGGEGIDTYDIKQGYTGEYRINNYANDLKVDILKIGVPYKDIKIVTDTDSDYGDLILRASDVLVIKVSLYSKSTKYQHLVIGSSDGVWFTVSTNEPYSIHPLYLDMKDWNSQHLNLSLDFFTTVSVVHGQRTIRNFISGNPLNNSLLGGAFSDVLEGLDGDDVLQGAEGEDFLSGGHGDDELHGGLGTDWIIAGHGSDIIHGGPGPDRIHGGPGSDTMLFTGDHHNKTGLMVNLLAGYGLGADAEGDFYLGVENVIGSRYADILIGSDYNNILSGENGDDIIAPLMGCDYLSGGEGSDTYQLFGKSDITTIDNFAKDQKRDIILLEEFNRQDLITQREGKDLLLLFHPEEQKRDNDAILIKHWFQGPEYQHLSIQLGDATVDLRNLIP